MVLTSTPEPLPLTERFLAAVALADEVHGHDLRSGTEIPYIAHLLVVTGLVIEDGGDEDEAIAALLHDSVEDGGGRPLLDRIRRTFGARVASLVENLSDSVDIDPQESWIDRKVRYLERLEGCEDEGVLRIALADKIHNARSIVRDYRAEGHSLWERFTQKTAQQQLWYYNQLVDIFSRKRPGSMAGDLCRSVVELAALVDADQEDSGEPFTP
ncbi:MAG TPA: HD domain-containing protein [Solirubrobacteraceae bacterium]|nr:HD domain-containing protein [Solirubrobacteraceae bacterium]